MEHSFPGVHPLPRLSSKASGHFAPQRAMSSDSFKRRRECEELTDSNEILFHEKKKHRPLALRTSPKFTQRSSLVGGSAIPPRFGLLTSTPAQSLIDYEDGFNNRLHNDSIHAMGQQFGQVLQTPLALDTPMDIDTGEDLQSTPKCRLSNHTSSILHRSTSQSFVPRQPTPMASAYSYSNVSMGSAPMVDKGLTPYGQNAILNSPSPEKDQDPVSWHHSRIPSPVSEGDMASAKDPSSDADMSCSMMYPQSPLADTLSMDAEPTNIQNPISSPSKGKATESHGSIASGKRLAFSMGYRADCDKCRRRVPGHYSHITESS